MPTSSRYITIGAAIALGLVFGSCDGSQPRRSLPTAPSSTSAPFLVRLELSAPSTIPPGESVQLTANAVKSDNSVENVTNQAQWSSSNARALEVSSAGVARGVGNGEAVIAVRYQTRSTSARTLVLPTGTYRLTGQVTDSGFGIADVTVTVISGIGEGLTAPTDASGSYALYGVAGRVRIQARKAGYLNRIDEVDVAANGTHGFELVAERPRTSLMGVYALTVAAGPCRYATGTLPDTAKSRTYTATVAQDGGRLTVTLTDADFIVTRGRGDHFAGFVDLNDLITFGVGDAYYYYSYSGQYDLVERFDDNSALVVSGSVTARATSSGISGTLDGAFMLAQGITAPFTKSSGSCYGNAHRFDLVRR